MAVCKLAGNWGMVAYGNRIERDQNGIRKAREYTLILMPRGCHPWQYYTRTARVGTIPRAGVLRSILLQVPFSNGQSRSLCEQKDGIRGGGRPVEPSVSQWGSRCSFIINST